MLADLDVDAVPSFHDDGSGFHLSAANKASNASGLTTEDRKKLVQNSDWHADLLSSSSDSDDLDDFLAEVLGSTAPIDSDADDGDDGGFGLAHLKRRQSAVSGGAESKTSDDVVVVGSSAVPVPRVAGGKSAPVLPGWYGLPPGAEVSMRAIETRLDESVRLVVFELHGCLVDDTVQIGRVHQPLHCVALTSAFKSFGMHLFAEDVQKHLGKRLEDMVEALYREHGPHGISDDEFRRDTDSVLQNVRKVVQHHHDESLTREVPGATALLEWLHARKIKVGVVAHMPQAHLHAYLERFGWKRRGLVQASVLVREHRPDLEHLVNLMERTDTFTPESVLRVGSNFIELREGAKADAWTAALERQGVGRQTRKSLQKAKPDFTLQSLRDVRTILTPWTARKGDDGDDADESDATDVVEWSE